MKTKPVNLKNIAKILIKYYVKKIVRVIKIFCTE